MTGAEHIKRLDTLKTLRQPFEDFWKDSYNNTYPLRGDRIGQDNLSTYDASGARSKQARIYDSTLKDACRQLASALLSGLTPANSRWFGQEVFNVKDEESNKWLDASADVIWRNIHNANYDITAYEFFLDYVLAGIPAMYISEGDISKGKLFHFQLWHLNSCYFSDSTGKGMIDTVYRLFTLTAEQAVKEYADTKYPLSEEIVKAAKDKPDTRFEFLQAVYPRVKKQGNELPIASEHVDVKTKKLVRKSGYYEMPVVVPRWLPIPNSVYSLGPSDDALVDHKTLNEVVKFVLQNADMAIAGMWGAVDDGILNPKTVTVGARKLIIMQSKDSLFPLTPGGRFDVSALEIDRLQKAIRKILMSDQLSPDEGPKMTATEIQVRREIIRQLLGPMYGRLMAEYLTPLVERCFGIAYRAELLGVAPETIQGQISKVVFKSPLARTQRLEDVAAIERFEAGLAAVVQGGFQAAADNYDIDKSIKEKSRLLGVPQDLMRNEKAVKKIREDREAAIQAAQQQAQEAKMQEKIAPEMTKGMMNKEAT